MCDDRECHGKSIGALGVVGLLCAAIGVGMLFGPEFGWLSFGCALISIAAAIGVWGR